MAKDIKKTVWDHKFWMHSSGYSQLSCNCERIAMETSFSDGVRMGKLFSQVTGQTPMSYRGGSDDTWGIEKNSGRYETSRCQS